MTPETYTVSVWVISPMDIPYDSSTEMLTFVVLVTDPCFTATIDLSIGVLPDYAPTYNIYGV